MIGDVDNGGNIGSHGSELVPVYYPMMVNICGKRCVVIGGGKVAERKISGLFTAQAEVIVISPIVTKQIAEWAEIGKLQLRLRSYEAEDVRGAFLVIAATNSEKVNAQINEDIHNSERGLGQGLSLFNRVDLPEYGDFIVPAMFRRGRLVVAVSTSGANPGVAQAICSRLEADIGEEYEILLDFYAEFRLLVRQLVDDPERRRIIQREVLKLDMIEWIRTGQFERLSKEILVKLMEENV